MKFGSFELDPQAYELKNAGQAVKLERIPMELLLLLTARQGKLITREEIDWAVERIESVMEKLGGAEGSPKA